MSAPDKTPTDYDPLQPLGVFLVVFGLAVLLALFVDMPPMDRFINLAAGLTVSGIGLAFWLVGHRRLKKIREKKTG